MSCTGDSVIFVTNRCLGTFLMMMPIKIIYVVLGISILVNKVNSDRNKRTIDVGWEAVHPPFDPNIYEEILDAELCAKQIDYLISNDTLLMITCKYCKGFLLTLSRLLSS